MPKHNIPAHWYDSGTRKRHYLDTVMDGEQVLIASKWYSNGKQRWEYVLEPVEVVEFCIELRRGLDANDDA